MAEANEQREHDAARSDSGVSTEERAGDQSERMANRLDDIHAADGASVMENLSSGEAADVAEYLDPNTASQILAEMDPTLAASVISDMEPPEAAMVLGAMDPDDRVDILEHVPQPLHDRLMGEMSATDAAEVRHLEQYPPES